MFSSGLATLVLLAIASVSGSPTPYTDKRDPQFSVNLPNRLPVSGNFPGGITISQNGTTGNSIVTFGNATTGARPFPFGGNRFPFGGFKREEEAYELMARDPQFSFNFTNRLPVNGRLPFGINIGQGADGNSIAFFGNATTGDRGFPFNFLPFKREEHELVERDPQFSFNFTNRLPVSGRLPFGINIGQGADGNSIAFFGNATTGDRGFPFNFLPFKREEHELVERDPQFSFNFTNRLPVTGRLPFGINIGQGVDGNSIAFFGNSTTGDRGFPFNFLPFKREEHELVERDPQFSFNFTNRLPVTGRLPFGINIGQGADGNSIAFFGNATTGDRGFPFNFLPFKREEEELEERATAPKGKMVTKL